MLDVNPEGAASHNRAPTTESKEPGALSSSNTDQRQELSYPATHGRLKGVGSTSLPQGDLRVWGGGLLPDSSRRFFQSFSSQADAPQTDEDLQACLEKSEPRVGPTRPPQSCESCEALMGPAPPPCSGKQDESDHAGKSAQERTVAGGGWGGGGGWCRERGISPPREDLLHYLVNTFLKGVHLTHPQKNIRTGSKTNCIQTHKMPHQV